MRKVGPPGTDALYPPCRSARHETALGESSTGIVSVEISTSGCPNGGCRSSKSRAVPGAAQRSCRADKCSLKNDLLFVHAAAAVVTESALAAARVTGISAETAGIDEGDPALYRVADLLGRAIQIRDHVVG